jgi:glycosyltransferase involved in cell wall biosynthesis
VAHKRAKGTRRQSTMRVLHIQKVSGIGGSERHLLALLPALAARGLDVVMCVLANGNFDRFVAEMTEAGVRTFTIRAGRDVNPMLPVRIGRLIHSIRPDLVHTHLIHGDVYGLAAARLAHVPAISSFHSTNSFYQQQPYRTTNRVARRLAKRTIAISDHVRRFLEEGMKVGADQIRVIPYGIDVSQWMSSVEITGAARRNLGIGEGEIVVGVASRLFPNKGHEFLLDGIALARQRSPELRLLVAGDGPLREQLEAYAHVKGLRDDTRFLGFVSDIKGFLAACDIFAFPSLPGFGEGFGLAALEAMAAARPVVATALDSLPEIVVNGETGLLVSPGNVHELGDVLMAMANDKTFRLRLGARGFLRAQKLFAIDPMVNRTIHVYDEVVSP